MKCKICNSETTIHDTALILNKYSVAYYRCSHCGFIQTEEPYWLGEAYVKAIATADTGIMARNLSNADDLIFFLRFIGEGQCLDFGGGHGVFTRIMRDYGFDFYHYDKYAENLFAAGFEANLNQKYRIITSFENFEHFVNPLEEIEKMIAISDTLYFSTSLIPSDLPFIKDWWYYSPSTGQHISFYSMHSLEYIALKYNMRLLSDGNNKHILTKLPIRKDFFRLLRYYNKIKNRLDIPRHFKKQSKAWDDMHIILDKK
jgi:hypothetical protein